MAGCYAVRAHCNPHSRARMLSSQLGIAVILRSHAIIACMAHGQMVTHVAFSSPVVCIAYAKCCWLVFGGQCRVRGGMHDSQDLLIELQRFHTVHIPADLAASTGILGAADAVVGVCHTCQRVLKGSVYMHGRDSAGLLNYVQDLPELGVAPWIEMQAIDLNCLQSIACAVLRMSSLLW